MAGVTESANIAVVGSINMDFVVETEQFPVPGQTLAGKSIDYFPGGKGANQAVAAARLGAKVRMVGAVGSDAFGARLKGILEGEGIDVSGVKTTDGSTGIAAITVSEGDNTIIVVAGANGEVGPTDVEAHRSAIEQSDVVLLQLEIPTEAVEAALRLARSLGKAAILNPAPARPIPDEWLRLADVLTPNETELAALAGTGPITGEDGLRAALDALHRRGVERIVVTLGAEGAALSERGGAFVRVPGRKVEALDTTGAGDTFHGALAVAWASGRSLPEAVSWAVDAAALSVMRRGAQTGMPTLAELEVWQAER